MFQKYYGVPFDKDFPIILHITPILLGNMRKIPLKKAWPLTIHKSQQMTLQRATADTRGKERQGLTFTTLSRVKSIDGLHISLPFSFQHYEEIKDREYVTLRKKEEERLKSI